MQEPPFFRAIMCCRRKHRYPDRSEALFGQLGLLIAGEGNLHTYKCEFCGEFHVGHRRPRRMP